MLVKNFYVDAESDGLYGKFLSVAVLVTDENGVTADRFYAAVITKEEDIATPWVRENVFPYLKNADTFYSNESELLDAFWNFWLKHKDDSICISYVGYPVESRLFMTCVMKNMTERAFLGPFPLYDLSTLLVAKGYDFNIDLSEISTLKLIPHDAMNDVKMIADVWKRLN